MHLIILCVNVFSTKVLIEDTFYIFYRRRVRHFRWSCESREGLAVCRAKAIPSFLSYFKNLSIGPAPGVEPATSCSAVKRSTDWAFPAAVFSGNNFKQSLQEQQESPLALTLSPLNPKIHIQILQTDLHTFSFKIGLENLMKDWDLILLTFSIDNVLTLLGETGADLE